MGYTENNTLFITKDDEKYLDEFDNKYGSKYFFTVTQKMIDKYGISLLDLLRYNKEYLAIYTNEEREFVHFTKREFIDEIKSKGLTPHESFTETGVFAFYADYLREYGCEEDGFDTVVLFKNNKQSYYKIVCPYDYSIKPVGEIIFAEAIPANSILEIISRDEWDNRKANAKINKYQACRDYLCNIEVDEEITEESLPILAEKILLKRELPKIDLSKYNLGITPFGVTLSEEDYKKHVIGRERQISPEFLNDYICVLHDGLLNFYHYSPNKLTEIRPSNKESLSFGPGIYCYNKETHKPVTTEMYLYEGVYKGKFLECVYDCDCEDDFNNKGEGNLKEYLLLTNESVPVKLVPKYTNNMNLF